jgi:hypothetical protein
MGFPFLVLTGVGFCFLDETPAYLLCKGKYEECKSVIRTITRVNKRPEFRFNLVEEMDEINQKYTSAMDIAGGMSANIRPMRDSSYWSIVSDNPHLIGNQDMSSQKFKISRLKLFKKYFQLFFLWAVHYLAYFGIPLLMGGGTTLILNFTFLGCIELLGILLSIKLLRHFSRIKCMRIFIMICLVTCILFYFFDYQFFLLIITKFFLTLFFGVLQIYTLEIIPVEIRSQGFGYCFTFGRLCAIFIPLFLGRFSALQIKPVLILAIFFLLSLFFMINLKETYTKKNRKNSIQ